MLNLDLSTVIFFSVLLSPVIALVLLSLRNAYPASVRGLGWWATGSISSAVGTVLIFQAAERRNLVLFVVGSICVAAGALQWIWGTERFLKAPGSNHITLPVAITGILTISGLVYASGRIQTGLVPLTVSIGVLHFIHFCTLLRYSEWKFGARFLGFSLLGLSLCWIGRAAFDTVYPNWPLYPTQTGFSGQIHALLSVLRLLTLLGFVVLASERIREEFQRMASHDSLTGALLRRSWITLAEREMARGRRHNRPLSLLAMDLDHFKQINDTLGHAAGDQALIEFVGAVSAHLRSQDSVGRIGGEEFVLLMPETSAEAARQAAERIRLTTEALGGVTRYTVSIGIAEMAPQDTSITELLVRADAAMYQAKALGRNQVVMAKVGDAGNVGAHSTP